ncbi:MAG: flavodoxin domain-containing protein [Christensenellales bacterium]
MQAIIYTSNTGHTQEYAQMLAGELGIPCYDLKQAKNNLSSGVDVIYLGWIMAGNVQGLKKALRRYSVKIVCAVGMSGNDNQLKEIYDKYIFLEDTPLFYLQGGLEYHKLKGVYKFMIGTIKKVMGKKLETKENKTQEEQEMFELIINGKSTVSKEKLSEVLAYLKEKTI